MSFKFNLKQAVIVAGETLEVVARAEYLGDGNKYMVDYSPTSRGMQRQHWITEQWWAESELKAAQ